VDAATTNAIAARARRLVGSLYHSSNKEAIVQALAARYTDAFSSS
jgi:AcrR family transcriptional regulator